MPTWLQLHVHALPREQLDAISTLLFELGATGIQESWPEGQAPPPQQPWDPTPPPDPDPVELMAGFSDEARGEVTARLATRGIEISWSAPPEVDWDARFRASFEPLVISDRLVMAPPWNCPDGAIVVEPGQGFGTGKHPTTRQALQSLDRLADGARTALDVGTGSGILALAATHLGLEVTGIDVDALAIAEAQRNATRNGMSISLSTTPLDRVSGTYDLVLANLHAELVVQLARPLVEHTAQHLVIAGVLEDREHLVRAALEGDTSLVRRQVAAPWVCLELRVR